MTLESVCERAVDRERERQRLGGRLPRRGIGAGELGHGCRRAGRERPHHVRRALELRALRGGKRDLADARPAGEVVVRELAAGVRARRDEPGGRCEQRVARRGRRGPRRGER